MEKTVTRENKRCYDELRPLHVTYDIFDFADGSLLFEVGNTKVMCAVTLQPGVPHFMRGEKVAWLTAEYAMLPAATRPRTQRDSQGARANHRNIEISRIIGRTLRAVSDLSHFGEYTIMIDCDVLQADAGTRAACISAASIALQRAELVWLRRGIIQKPILSEPIVAVSVGLAHDAIIVDPDYTEELTMDADLNFIMTRGGNIVEIQGGAEKNSFSWDQLQTMYRHACKGAQTIFSFFDVHGHPHYKTMIKQEKTQSSLTGSEKIPFFSLQNRVNVSK